MWQDPVVKETRKRREEYSAKFKHDPDAIFDEICNRQSQPGKKLVSLPGRKPTPMPSAAYPKETVRNSRPGA